MERGAMNKGTIWMKRLTLGLTLVAALVVAPPQRAWAEDFLDELDLDALLSGEVEVKAYEFPHVPAEFTAAFGWRSLSVTGSDSLAGFDYIGSSPTAVLEYRLFSYPHRVYFFGEFLNEKDYFSDLRYAYGDTVLFRGLNRATYHNYEYEVLSDLDTSTASPGILRPDMAYGVHRDYGAGMHLSSYWARIKPTDHAAHITLDYWHYGLAGTRQLRTLQGSGWYDNIVRSSEPYSVDWDFRQLNMKADAHLGPVEVQLMHRMGGVENVGTDTKTSTYGGTTAVPYAVLPETGFSDKTIKIHTNLTGRLVASATLSVRNDENTTSGAETEAFSGSASLTWLPTSALSVFARYRHHETEASGPALAQVVDPLTGTTWNAAVPKAIESSTDMLHLSARYRLTSATTLRASWDRKADEHANTVGTTVAASSTENRFGLAGETRLGRTLGLRAAYQHKAVDNPAYNNVPDSSDLVSASANWTPFTVLNLYAGYRAEVSEREGLVYSDTSSARNRETMAESVMTSLAYMPTERFTLTAAYARMLNSYKQDVVYYSTSVFPFVAPDAVCEDSSASYSLDMAYRVASPLHLTAGVAYVRSEGAFETNVADLTAPKSVASLTDYEVAETHYHAGMRLIADSGWFGTRESSLTLNYEYSDYEDVIDQAYDGFEDGSAQMVSVQVALSW